MVTESKIEMPEYIADALETLEANGFEAYIVGGCVRDALLCRASQDWDITTSAKPDKVKACFPCNRVLETGVKHGTVTILFGDNQAEITTFRVDGEYSDRRHPDSVSFTRDLESDLARRDFTVNALAYNPKRGLVDLFGGAADIKNRRIVCVGDAESRFSEDALRILRAVRFASTLGFNIDEATAQAMDKLAFLLDKISPERIASELCKALTGQGTADVLTKYPRIFMRIIPELEDAIDFEQHTKYHHLDVWRHTVEAVNAAPPDFILRLVMLLHDCGKPKYFTLDKDGTGHFYNHANISAEIADTVLKRLRFNNATSREVVYLVKHHSALSQIKSDSKEKYLKRMLNKMGEERLRRLISVKRADCSAQSPEYRAKRLEALDSVESTLNEIILQKQAFSLKDLAINGNDLLESGFDEGKQIGEALNTMLELVMDGELDNTLEALTAHAKKLRQASGG